MNAVSKVLALVCVCSTPTLAENQRLEEVVVTSSRVEMPLRQIGTSMSVVSAEDIQALGFTNLSDILRTQPGIATSNTGGQGQPTALRVRGEDGFRTLVLFDGIDISDPSGVQVTPRNEHILSSGIQRVEILRGPQGLMYGADAGGIINISSKRFDRGFAGTVSGEGGRYGTHQFAADLGGGNDIVDASLSAADYETDGFNALGTDTDLADDDGYENTTLHGRLGWNATDTLRVEVVGRDVDAKTDYDNCYTDAFELRNDCHNEVTQTSYRAAISYSGETLSHALSYDSTDTDSKFFTEGQRSFALDGEMQRAGYLGTWAVMEGTRLVYGVDLKSESMDDGSTDIDRDQAGYYLEYQGGFADSLYVTTGVRYDDNDDFGTHTSYRVSGAWLNELGGGTLKLKATYGTGFRAPSPFEVSTNNQPWNPDIDLQEEKSHGYDLGVEYFANSGLYLELVWFDQTIEDEIFYDFVTFGYDQGDGNFDSSGIELAAEVPLYRGLKLNTNYTWNDTENAVGENRVRRPKHLANLALNYHTDSGKLVLGLNLRASSDAEAIDGSNLDDYEVLNFNVSYQLIDDLEIYGRIENLLDENYQEVKDYNSSGAAGYAGLRYSF